MTAVWSAARNALRAAGGALLDLALPRVCAACSGALRAADRDVVCGTCWSRLSALPAPRCDRCGHPRRDDACRWCRALPPFVRAGRSVCWLPGGSATAIVYALKYHGWSAVAEGMAARMARLPWPADVVEERRALVPVPLTPARRRERGYNQSTLLAEGLAARWGVPVWHDALERTHSAGSQTRLTPTDRLGNVSGAFRAVPVARARLRGAHVVLVDDVVTTGATINACAAALCDGGARIVSFVTFGRAPALGDRSN